ncbi:Eukaryotic protein of unknown function (DUF953) [Popillia japonica]|uniref:Thioredoxin domain-containing protein 17 n=1 Tax=Popillia japonica TaxID=7064 RepID=A0AAW1LFW0_POPJA
MVIKHQLKGYEAFTQFVDNLKENKGNVYILFSGSKSEDGQSWCPDCVRAKPVVEDALKYTDENSQFVYVEVGDRSFWKDSKCPFRTDKRTKLLVIPTLVRWGHPQKLEGEQCENPDLVEMLFQEE